MNLTPREKAKLLVSVAAIVAERRLKRGGKLIYPAAVALITDFVLEGARDGKTVAELMRDGASVISQGYFVSEASDPHIETQGGSAFPRHQAITTLGPPSVSVSATGPAGAAGGGHELWSATGLIRGWHSRPCWE